jgi:hypothetical protein
MGIVIFLKCTLWYKNNCHFFNENNILHIEYFIIYLDPEKQNFYAFKQEVFQTCTHSDRRGISRNTEFEAFFRPVKQSRKPQSFSVL